MDERRKKKREIAEAKIAEEERRKNPKLQTQFADLKRGLSSLTDADWEGIPEAGNMTGKRRKHNMRLEENQNGRSYAVSDSVLAGAAARGQMLGELDAAQQEVCLFLFLYFYLVLIYRTADSIHQLETEP
jgi:pre-mRNA-processing factor 6